MSVRGLVNSAYATCFVLPEDAPDFRLEDLVGGACTYLSEQVPCAKKKTIFFSRPFLKIRDSISYISETFCSLVVPCRKGGYLVSIGKSVCHFDWDTKSVTVLQTVDTGLDTRINDGKCDASGRLWFGTMTMRNAQCTRTLYKGSLYSLELDGAVRKHKDGVTVSNGVAWTADNSTMFYIDSHPRLVYAYDFCIKSGIISNEKVCIDFNDSAKELTGFPDGMTIDVDGKLWVACFNGGKIIQFDPVTGSAMATICVPVNRPTSCCFGGKNFDEMFVTCSRYNLPEEELSNTPLAGSVFRITGLSTRGSPASLYEGVIHKTE